MDCDQAIARIYEHLDNDRVENALMACLRVARATKDYLNAAIFLRELFPNKSEVARALYDETAHLNDEARKFLYETSLNRWLDVHTVEGGIVENDDVPEGEKRNVLMVAIGQLDSELEQWKSAISDLTLPPGMGAFDAAAFTDSFLRQKEKIRMRINAVSTIRARVKTRCLNYAIGIERQLEGQKKGQGFLEGVQNDVNNYFKARSDDVYNKLRKAAQLSASSDLEDFLFC